MSDELIGAELGGRYRVEQKVGDAMLGRVYSARSVEDGRLYHVKVPYANVAGNPEKSERFRRELEAMARIENPHTLRVIDTGIHDSVAFLVLEYLAATPLSDVLERGPLKPARVAGIVAQIATACEAAHAAGIVHRNLSPQTILLLDNARDRDFVKVTDFGLSRIVDADADEAGGVLTQAGTRIGNVSYMAPEYIEQDEVLPRRRHVRARRADLPPAVRQAPVRGQGRRRADAPRHRRSAAAVDPGAGPAGVV